MLYRKVCIQYTTDSRYIAVEYNTILKTIQMENSTFPGLWTHKIDYHPIHLTLRSHIFWKVFSFISIMQLYCFCFPAISNSEQTGRYWEWLSMGFIHVFEDSDYDNNLREANIRQHDDVIKWKHFPCYWPFVQWCFDVFFSMRLYKRLRMNFAVII